MISNSTSGEPTKQDPVDASRRLFLPPRLVDGFVLTAVVLLYAGFIFSRVALHGPQNHRQLGPVQWHAREILAAALFPSVFALWWRREKPVVVFGVAVVVQVVTGPFGGLFLLVALYAAALRLPLRRAAVAWMVAALALLIGSSVDAGKFQPGQIFSYTAFPAAIVALGQYVAARRAYVERLRERALYARALASFLPPSVAKLVAATPSALSLRDERIVTVVFSDIRGFSSLAERLPPREVADIVGGHLAAMAEVVQDHGGTLDKFVGDAVMAVFGAPQDIPDHAARAIACAIAMQRRQSERNAGASSGYGRRIDIGIGINTGTVVAGTLGGVGRLDYTVIGDAVNVAQRLQGEAGREEILASAATIKAADYAAAEKVGSRQLKGRQESVEVYRISWSVQTSGYR